jgi:hypothetical protein
MIYMHVCTNGCPAALRADEGQGVVNVYLDFSGEECVLSQNSSTTRHSIYKRACPRCMHVKRILAGCGICLDMADKLRWTVVVSPTASPG